MDYHSRVNIAHLETMDRLRIHGWRPNATTRWIGVSAVVLATWVGRAGAVDFNHDIKPIFSKHCYSCHGPEKQKAGLRLDRKTDAFRGGDSGTVIVPHKGAGSLLFKNISGANPDSIMPPKGSPLTPAQVALIKAWIDEGAAWPDEGVTAESPASTHWSFQPPKRPKLPAVKEQRWARNPIDDFILARLEQQKIKPSRDAEKTTLIRRLSLDLLGLPPTPEEVKQFLEDKNPHAYEKLVDRLLASPHFGERWGRHWLDLARYADSDGYEKDSPRPYAYLYRDWVINAINRDMPFDKFTIEQLAGDLLPEATLEQKIATGFHRQSLVNKEGGIDQEEYRNKAVVDRVSTTGATWLGLTVGCAECHSHKYDPLTQREFYQLFAFFNNTDDHDLPAPTSTELKKYDAAKSKWEAGQERLKVGYDKYVTESLPARQAAWEATGKLDPTVWNPLEMTSGSSDSGAILTKESDQSIVVSGTNTLTDTYTVIAKTSAEDVTGFRIEVLPDDQCEIGPGRSGKGSFVLSEFKVMVQPANGAEPQMVTLSNATADFSQKNWAVDGAIDGRKNTGWGISPETRRRHLSVFECSKPLKLKPDDTLVFTLDQQQGEELTVGRFRLAVTASPLPLRARLPGDLVAASWNAASDQRTAAQKAALTDYFRDQVDPEAARLRELLKEDAKKQPLYPETKAATLVEREKPRMTHIHVRGDFLQPGDLVEPATPAVLHPFRARSARPDRLDLAYWLLDPANPLTSRVTVNHVWKNLFGRGLVASMNDFGTRGEKPSHPELLDWLATEFPRLGWSRKALIKLIVTSATYRQSSQSRPDLADIDPLNTLLARQSRLRLEAETVRDVHLRASGLLCEKVGGPSVRPALPADIAALGYASSMKWKESVGEDRYRRGMYIFFQRTVPYPMLMTFDAPDSNTTCTRRERSDTPLQALTLWNDPVFFDCARALVKRVVCETSLDARLKAAFRLCMARAPEQAELSRLHRLCADQQRLIRENPESAAAILGADAKGAVSDDVVEQATLVAISRTLMNLDEFITRD